MGSKGTPGPASTAGGIDADGHLLEPADLWLNYLEPKYRDRALRVVKNDDGLEVLLVDGKPGSFLPPGFLGIIGAMGEELTMGPESTYGKNVAFGAMNAKDRVTRLTNEGMRAALLYPSIGLAMLLESKDAELKAAHCRAYNRWLLDFCSDSGGRLVPIAQVSLSDAEEAARELERAVRAGAKGGFFLPADTQGKSPAHPDFDKFWATAQDLGVPISMHPIAEQRDWMGKSRFQEFAYPPDSPVQISWFFLVTEIQAMQQVLISCFQHDLFGRYPKVKLVVLESTAAWIGPLLEFMDEKAEGMFGATLPLKEPPSHYFKRQCWIAADPDERVVLGLIDYVGADRFVWSSDFPHPDHDDKYMHHLAGLVGPLSEEKRQRILWKNVAECYGLQFS